MGGIFAVFLREGNGIPIVVEGLRRLKYRGAETSGIAYTSGGALVVLKDVGDVDALAQRYKLNEVAATVVLGHTRFSTHGRPHVDNAHPHTDCFNRVAVVGDGAIANYEPLRDQAVYREHRLRSRSDFEVVAHMIEDELKAGKSFREAFASAVKSLEGFFTVAALNPNPETVAVYTSHQDFFIGFSPSGYVASSDMYSLFKFVDKFVRLKAGEAAFISGRGVEIVDLRLAVPVEREAEELRIEDPSLVGRGGFRFHMEREIREIPYALLRTVSAVQDRYLTFAAKALLEAKSVYIVADGTSLHAGFVGSYYLSELARVNPIVVSAGEFPLYFVENVGPGTVVMAISQSGETRDVVSAVYEAKLRGATIVGVTNYVGSSLANMSNVYLPIAAGPELSIPATKTFTSTMAVIYMLSLKAAQIRGALTQSEYRERLESLKRLADVIAGEMSEVGIWASEAAKIIAQCRSGYIVSRGITYPIALEGALKFKEVAYVHAEGVEAGEFKHGPQVLVERGFFTVFIVPVERGAADATYPLIEMAASNGATTIAIGFKDERLAKLTELGVKILEMPRVDRHLAPIELTVPLQFTAFSLGLELGRPIDNPRYLVKRVMV